jgi:hypothetical protein
MHWISTKNLAKSWIILQPHDRIDILLADLTRVEKILHNVIGIPHIHVWWYPKSAAYKLHGILPEHIISIK